MPLIVTLTRYSLVKGERIVRYVIITRLRDFFNKEVLSFYIQAPYNRRRYSLSRNYLQPMYNLDNHIFSRLYYDPCIDKNLWIHPPWLGGCNQSQAPNYHQAGIAQLGERQTEDLKVACSIHSKFYHSVGYLYVMLGQTYFAHESTKVMLKHINSSKT
ncbi:hypothetical protein MTR_8g075380 [Medicago truncatula]|uniref:Uncharacterized protein n=1 Tax=Medicago truncatula TaxID=3880 RepID=G7LC11_MEDTR|nr:hypothetical protein MTR_8g075380 [Medicago truncatula]